MLHKELVLNELRWLCLHFCWCKG